MDPAASPALALKSGPARPVTAAQHVVARLREAILSGEIPAGTPLRQEEIAAALGVSRTPVRESLRILQTEGWLAVLPNRGAVVASLSGEEAREIFDMRQALESLALARSIPRLGASDLDAAAAIVAEMDRVEDPARWVALHRRFHLALYVGAGPRLRASIEALYDAVDRYLRVELQALDNAEESQAEHHAILAACRDGDVARALALYETHIAEAGDDLARAIERRSAGHG